MLQTLTCVSVHCDQCGDSPYSPGPDLEAHWPSEDAALTAAAAAGCHVGHRPPRLLCRDCGTVLRCEARGHEFTGWRRCRCEQLVAAHRAGPGGVCAMALRYCLRCSVLESRPEVPLLPCGCPEQLVTDEGHQLGCSERVGDVR
jgi:hypothetical protein